VGLELLRGELEIEDSAFWFRNGHIKDKVYLDEERAWWQLWSERKDFDNLSTGVSSALVEERSGGMPVNLERSSRVDYNVTTSQGPP